MRGSISVILTAALLVAGCGDSRENMEETPQDQPAGEQPEVTPSSPDNGNGVAEPSTTEPSGDSAQPPNESSVSDSPAAPVAVAVSDLAARLELSAAAINVVLTEDVTWSDGSLGCPEPGMAYTQALVDGFRIVLEADGDEYHYHAASGDDPFYCANPARPAADLPGDT